MDQALRDRVMNAAYAVRYWAEARAVGTFGEYDLCGFCAVASAELFKALKKEGIKAEIHGWNEREGTSAHVYLVVDDHVVDITATQFTRLKDETIYIKHLKEAEQWEWYQTTDVFQSVADLIKWQRKNRWPGEQIAWSKMVGA